MNVRPRLSYANVVATLALVLALGGGTVYAAAQLGRDDVKSKNIAPGAVETSDLDKNAVTSRKVDNGAIRSEDLAAKVFDGVDLDVTGSASGGPQGGLTTDTRMPLALTGKTTFTPRAGEVAALAAEGEFTIATTNAAESCSPAVFLLVDGRPTRVFVSPESEGNSTALETVPGRDADGPFGLLEPGEPLTVSAEIRGDVDCTADSRLDRLEVRIVQIR